MNLSHERPVEVDSKTLKVAIYARKSNKDETGRNKSVEDQVRSCTQLIQFFGYSPDNVRVFAEDEGAKGEWWWEGSSGPLPHRPRLGEMMRAVADGEIDAVCTWRLDRMVRQTEVALELRNRFKEKGVALLAGTRRIDLETADGEFAYTVEAAANEKYRKRLGEDIRRAHSFKAQLGMLTRDPSCFGFRTGGKGSQAVVPVPEELEVVRRIFRWFVYGDGESGPLGMGEIARRLMGEGVRVKGGVKGHQLKLPDLIAWPDIRRILTNCMFVARWRHGGQEHPMDMLLVHDAEGRRTTVVPLELYDEAQRKLDETRIRGKKAVTSQYLLSGLVVCGFCGRPQKVSFRRRNDGSVVLKYCCQSKAATKAGSCPSKAGVGIQVDTLDDWVMAHLLPDLREKIEETRFGGRDEDERMLASLERQLTKAKDRETNDLERAMGALDGTQFAALAQRLRSEREKLERNVSEVRRRVNSRDTVYPDLTDDAVKRMSVSILKDALRKCVKFIATTQSGLTVCDAWDGYLGADWVQVPNGRTVCGAKRRSIAAPTLEANMNALRWISDPEMFLDGRRFALGRSARNKTDEELLPGIEFLRDKQRGDDCES